ncbi:MAG: gliding motility lipoprotein GldH [Bacteroides sp.]|nr:gliding motility lipoprotein GldH [Bacteroidales bacterium]MBD5378522.1 gliding motility lipoprotein GldH [Bacteroides sp.]
MSLKTDFIIAILSMLILSACSEPKDYTEFHHLPDGGWCFGHPELFNPEHDDSISTGELSVTFRHSSSFPYESLSLEVVSQGLDGSRVADTIHVPLIDRFGNWTGSGSGAYIQVETPLNSKINHIKDRSIEVRHIMKLDTLRGLDIVGIKYIPD